MHPQNSTYPTNNINKQKPTRTTPIPEQQNGDSSPFMSAYGQQIKTQTFTVGEDRTKQSFKDECDINRIMSRYQVTGQLSPDHLNRGNPQYIDATGYEYQEAMQTVIRAQTLFDQLPSSVRDTFDNDPAEFLVFAENPDNAPELLKMGLGARPVPPVHHPSTPTPATPSTPVKTPANGIPNHDLPGIPPA